MRRRRSTQPQGTGMAANADSYEIVVTVSLPGSTDERTRQAFWRQYREQARREGYVFHDPEEPSDEQLEVRIRSDFAARLSDELLSKYERRAEWRNVAVKLIRLEYGSLELFLKIFGLEDASLLPFLIAAMETYTPRALNGALPGSLNVPFAASARLSPFNIPQADVAVPEQYDWSRLAAVSAASLLTPVILAAVALYFGYRHLEDESARLITERSELASERKALLREKTETLQIMMGQNASLNSALVTAVHGASGKSETASQAASLTPHR